MRSRVLAVLAMTLLVPVMAACGSSESTSSAPSAEIIGAQPAGGADLAGTSWQLTGGSFGAGLPADVIVTLVFSEAEASGNSGVNTYMAGFQSSADGSLSFSEIATTRMAGEPDAMAFEAEYLAALQATFGYTADEESLTLFGAADQEMTFTAG